MKVLVKIPTRSRGAGFFKRYLDYAKEPDTRFLISLDHDDKATIKDFEKYQCIHNIKIVIGTSTSKIDAVNRDIQGEDFDILVIGSDDMLPMVEGYDTQIIKLFKGDKYKYLWSSDSHQDRICTIPIMGKDYYDKFGYVYHPDYKSFFCDNEQTEVAVKLKACIKTKEVFFKHLHPAWAKKGEALQRDALYIHNDKYWKHDEAIYNARKRIIV